jgi:C1A family cysteine protease
VDENFKKADASSSHLDSYDDLFVYGGHAVAIVGYDKDWFLIRNSWGEDWGEKGFVYVSAKYFERAFTEAYGVIV